MSAHPPLLCSAISLSGSLWVLPVEEKCLWCLITTWHCRTSDCSFQLSSWVTLFLPASHSWAGGADSIIQQQGWVDSLASCLPFLTSLYQFKYTIKSNHVSKDMSVKKVTWEDYCNSLDFMGIPSGSLRDWQWEVPKTAVTKKVTWAWLQTRVSPRDFEVKCPSLQQILMCLQRGTKNAFSLYFISSAVKGVNFVRS